MQLLLIRRSDTQPTTFPARLLIKGIRFEVECHSGKCPDHDADDQYDLAIVDLSRLDRAAQRLLDQQQDSAHIPIIALVPNEALVGRKSNEALCPMAAGSNPVAMPELTSRMQAMVDKMAGPSGKMFRAAGLTISPEAGYAAFAGAPLSLSRRELAALTLLVRFAPHIVPRQRLEARVYGPDAVLTSNAIEAVLSRLRRSLKDAGCLARIVAHRGVGWSLKSAEGDRL
ncbi:winged helix-turn-helix domain-containing protein [Cognatiyoonia sp. IB215446]|uniref:winged helix-turn-helix domain-containing protein n=1 Tax=Cognatiyoonia sp. IB215446 TaxID=3097355 RepID=UPI002A16E001|nr:winged helix-turn-helix domain-containing protein [Cognatiyoonia sp. IB215446]MDX8348104.1 winged helix-turn-helix domain-containing protein [Cognatiyoonia sp. IB215446]